MRIVRRKWRIDREWAEVRAIPPKETYAPPSSRLAEFFGMLEPRSLNRGATSRKPAAAKERAGLS
jgi:hypothetical protein